jgi:hypothetical protein
MDCSSDRSRCCSNSRGYDVESVPVLPDGCKWTVSGRPVLRLHSTATDRRPLRRCPGRRSPHCPPGHTSRPRGMQMTRILSIKHSCEDRETGQPNHQHEEGKCGNAHLLLGHNNNNNSSNNSSNNNNNRGRRTVRPQQVKMIQKKTTAGRMDIDVTRTKTAATANFPNQATKGRPHTTTTSKKGTNNQKGKPEV